MSGVCAKHEQYVQPGEACPYCEPALGLHMVTQGASAIFGIGPPAPQTLVCDHRNRSVNRDACDKCGMSGMAIMQQRSVTIPVGTGPIE